MMTLDWILFFWRQPSGVASDGEHLLVLLRVVIQLAIGSFLSTLSPRRTAAFKVISFPSPHVRQMTSTGISVSAPGIF